MMALVSQDFSGSSDALSNFFRSSRASTQVYIAANVEPFGKTARPPIDAERRALEAIIGQLGELEADWDGYGAAPIDQDIIDQAISIGRSLLVNRLPLPDVVPNSNGTISFEWDSQVGLAQLEIGRTRFSFAMNRNHGERAMTHGLISNFSMNELVVIRALLELPSMSTSPTTCFTINFGAAADGLRNTIGYS